MKVMTMLMAVVMLMMSEREAIISYIVCFVF